VNTINNRVLGVVSKGYRLVSNSQALEWAYQCCQTVFPETKRIEWEVKACDAPATGGHCFIDLVHNSAVLDMEFVPVKERPDTYGPFIRVINSYNGLRALTFDIGFFRKVCKNGLILPQSIIYFKFIHMQKDIDGKVQFDIAHENLSKLKENLSKYLGVLNECKLDREKFETLLFGVLHIRKPQNIGPESQKAKDWDALEKGIDYLCDKYADELRENAYAAFNAMTEFASHPPQNKCLHRERHSFQRLVGNWVNNFTYELRQPGFSLPDYIEKISDN
jgi:hypothetical protein